MRKYGILISLILQMLACRSQTTFSKLYWNYPYTTLGLSVAFNEENFFITGRGASYIDGFLLPNLFYLKTDVNGNQLLSESLIGELNYTFREGYTSGLEFINDSVLAVAGTFTQYDTLFPPWNSEHNGLIVFLNLHGDTILTRRYIGDGYTEFARLLYDKRNDRLLTGWATRDTLLANGYMYTICTDITGNKIWDLRFGDGIKSEIGGLIDSLGSGMLIVGGIRAEADGERNGLIYKLNSSGVQYFSKEIGTTGDDSEIEVKVSKNGHSYIVRQYLDTVINDGDYEYVQYIGKTDTSLNFIWRTFLNDIYYKYIYTLRTFEDGSIVAVGTKIIDETYEPYGYIVKLDSNGIILWERSHASNLTGSNYLYDFQKLPNGDFVCSGKGVDTIDGVMQSMCWLLRLDSMGCLEPGCGEVAINNFTTQEEVLIQLYPNPMHQQASIAIHVPTNLQIVAGQTLECDIVDMQGRVVDHYSNIYINNPGETIRFTVFKRHLSAGTYLVTVRYGHLILGTVEMQCAG